MMRRNVVCIDGRSCKDVELKQVNNSQVATIRLASNKRIKNRKTDEWEDKTTYVDIECWGPRAEFAAKHISRGTVVGVTGELELDEWGPEGDRRSKLKIRANDLQVDFSSKDDDGGSGSSRGSRSSSGGGGGGDADLPF